ncbi:hypothetical protein OG884_12240 [Streptosporangium sp. NBC_01755]|nr:hypothetical protein [Streptosporangium sp. NBC_01755]WSD02632.1 hypothetical protein OG884_12240 [Streptosporangium sp. NBC_01755]
MYDWDYMKQEAVGTVTKSALAGEILYDNNHGKKSLQKTYIAHAKATGRGTVSALHQVTSVTPAAGGGYTVVIDQLNTTGGCHDHQDRDRGPGVLRSRQRRHPQAAGQAEGHRRAAQPEQRDRQGLGRQRQRHVRPGQPPVGPDRRSPVDHPLFRSSSGRPAREPQEQPGSPKGHSPLFALKVPQELIHPRGWIIVWKRCPILIVPCIKELGVLGRLLS